MSVCVLRLIKYWSDVWFRMQWGQNGDRSESPCAGANRSLGSLQKLVHVHASKEAGPYPLGFQQPIGFTESTKDLHYKNQVNHLLNGLGSLGYQCVC